MPGSLTMHSDVFEAHADYKLSSLQQPLINKRLLSVDIKDLVDVFLPYLRPFQPP